MTMTVRVAVPTAGTGPAPMPVRVTGTSFEHRFTLPRRATWVRAEVGHPDGRRIRQANCPRELLGSYCRNRILVLAMTSALYLGK